MIPLPAPINDPIWLTQMNIFVGYTVNPEARYEARESVKLAFLAALQSCLGINVRI